MGRAFFKAKKTQQEIDNEYATALGAFNTFLLAQQQSQPSVQDATEIDGNIQEQAPLLTANSIGALSTGSLQRMRNEIVKLTGDENNKGTHPELKEVMTRAFNATKNFVNNPLDNEARKEFFKAQLAVSRFGDITKGVSNTMIAIGFVAFTVGLILLFSGVGTIPGAAVLVGLGFALAMVGAGTLGASQANREIKDRSKIAGDMSETRRASPKAN